MQRKKISKSSEIVSNYVENFINAGAWFTAEDIPARICGHNSLNILRGLVRRGKISSEQDPKSLLGYERFKKIGNSA